MQFDFDKGHEKGPGDEAASAGSNMPEFTVSELSGRVKRVVESEFSFVRVRGELGRVSQPASGHIYLDLKDEKAVISGVIWRGKAASIAVRPEQGLEVVVTGKLTTFPGQSRYQIVIEKLEPAGQGALMALLEERKKKLAAEGLLDESAKQKLPFMPRVVGVVTSPSGAVIRDMMHGFKERFPVHVLVWPVRVQGETAAREIANAINGFNEISGKDGVPRPDVLIVARGGGSLEDLWSFNEEIVARAAAASHIPLISAVGHETDWTLIDYVADARAPTPTKAAEWAVPKYSELVDRIADLHARQIRVVRRGLESKRIGLQGASRGLPRLVDLLGIPRQRLDGAGLRLLQGLRSFALMKRQKLDRSGIRLSKEAMLQRTERGRERLSYNHRAIGLALSGRVRLQRQRLREAGSALRPQMMMRKVIEGRKATDQARQRQVQAFTGQLRHLRARLVAAGQMLQSLSYQSVLARGFALVRGEAGTMIRSRTGLSEGDRLDIEFADGYLAARVSGGPAGEQVDRSGDRAGRRVKEESQNGPKRKRSFKKTPDGGAQGSLF